MPLPKPTSPPLSNRPTTSGGSGIGSVQTDSGALEDATLSEPVESSLWSSKKPSTAKNNGDFSDDSASSESSHDSTSSGTKRNPPTTSAKTRPSSSSKKAPVPGSAGSSGSPANPSMPNEVTARSSSTSSTILAVVSASVGTLALLMLFVIARRRSTQPLKENDGSASPSFLQLPATPKDSTGDRSAPRVGFLANDVRNGEQLASFCLYTRELKLGKTIAHGGYGIIYRGVYDRRAVAIKQMLPDAWRNEATLARFTDEIRLCARLQHPQIVEFVGIAWTSLRDLSHTAPPPEDWQQMWTPAKLQNKAAIARDVAEAVVYLHSRPTPILHRDLMARNVLLSDNGAAKLSDFGISCEVAIDVTMTSEIGTAAWIAPEILRGERYSEKADIYSFGVLLVEMDTGGNPFAGDDSESVALTGSVNTNSAFKQANMMLLVSTGKLRPTPSTACPLAIQSLVHECLRFDPEERPTMDEVTERLRLFAEVP